MKKHALVAGLVLASSFATAPMAVAQTAAPAVLDVTATAACGRVTLAATVNEDFNQNGFDTYEIAVFSGPNAGGTLSTPEGQFFVTAEKPVVKTFTLDEDAYDGSGFATWSTVSGPNPEFFVRGAIAVDTDCAPPVTTVPPPPVTTDPPAPTTTVTLPPTTPTTPPVVTTPPPASSDGFSQVRVVPQGGVDTGTR